MSEFKDPETAAREVAENAADGGPGVQRDTLAEAVADANNAGYHLEQMYVTLDAICDDGGLYPGSVASSMRERQKQINALAEWMEEFRVALRAEFEGVDVDTEEGADA